MSEHLEDYELEHLVSVEHVPTCTVCGRLPSRVSFDAALVAAHEHERAHTEEYVRPTGMCPHCGEIVRLSEGDWLTATHDWPKPTRQVCPGSQQNPRNAESDGRPLWNGEANPHFYRNQRDQGERP